MLRVVGKKTPNNNIESEDRFARQNCYNASSRGNSPAHTNIAARHVLPEASAWHRISMDALHRRMQAPAPMARRPEDRVYRTAHLAFMSIKSKEHNGNLQLINAAWTGLSPHDQAFYDQYVGVQDDRPSEPLAQRTFEENARQACPFRFGTSSYPLSEDRIKNATCSLDAAQKQWADLVGNLFGPEGSSLDGAVFSQCCETYGMGRCADDFTDAEQEQWKELRKVLVAVSRIPVETVAGAGKLNMVAFVGEAPPAGSGDVVVTPTTVEWIHLAHDGPCPKGTQWVWILSHLFDSVGLWTHAGAPFVHQLANLCASEFVLQSSGVRDSRSQLRS